MKVVINKQYGGFGLSRDAQLEINKRQCPHNHWEDEESYFGGHKDLDIKIWGSVEKARATHAEMCEMVRRDGKILIDDHNWAYKKPEVRACPILVAVVESLGERANGHHASLKIIEVPDGVEWTIEEYDGTEWIAEKHRTWGRKHDC